MRTNQHEWESGSEAHSKCILTQGIDYRWAGTLPPDWSFRWPRAN
jgi:hypothetical protein